MKYALWVFFFLAAAPHSVPRVEAAWERASLPSAAEAPIDLARCQNVSECFYAATPSEVFQNTKGSWRSVFIKTALADPIVRIYTFPGSQILWVQTSKSIFSVSGSPLNARSIYTAENASKFPLSFCASKNTLWVGTSSGMWASEDQGVSWQKKSALADSLPVSLVVHSSIGLFFSVGGDWRLAEEDRGETVLKLFGFQSKENFEEGLSPEFQNEEPASAQAFFFDFLETEESFYLATSKGVFQSQNGFDWQALSGSGLKSAVTTRLLWNKTAKALSALTLNGFFNYDPSSRRWRAQNDGFARTDLSSFLFLSNSNRFIAVNSEGLWIWKDSNAPTSADKKHALLFNQLIRLEPSAREIHHRVIQYSDTSNGKIKRWHRESRLAALAPSLSLGKDWGTSNNIDLDRASTNDPDRFIDGPWDKDRGADFDLSWDLGDFIFSSSQTSIDSRAKLMIDQRNDLLAEATRIFYERRRMQAEAIYSPAADEAAHLERLLRLDELTSLLDALTGGYLSERLEKIYQQNPKLEALWHFEGQAPQKKNSP